GKRVWRSLTFAGKKTDAEKKLTEVMRAKDTGTYVEPNKLTVREFLERWLRDYVATRIPKLSTRASYTARVRKHVIPTLGALPLTKLTPGKIQELYRVKLESGLSSTTVNDVHRVLHRALVYAVKLGLVARNVCDATEPPKRRRPEMATWTPAECLRFLATAQDNRYHPLFATAIYSGLRQGELLGLRWTDVDLDAGTLTVQQTLEKAGTAPRFGTPKTKKSRRTVPIPAEAVIVLRAWKAEQNQERLLRGPAYRDYGLVFTVAGGAPVSRHNLCRRDFATLTARAGVPRVRFHDLRHTSATLLLAANVNPKVVSERLGHSGIGITMDTYSHVTPTMQRDAANVLGRVLGAARG
ncbi:MAG TPA: site-specific integrase, partial [Chloroflexota bacterium]|nr:site-specific integrase [Chloroflexota bacterium]